MRLVGSSPVPPRQQTVGVAAPTLPDQVETIDIYLTLDFAKLMITQLSAAVEVAAKECTR
jgi:hypothetical protein